VRRRHRWIRIGHSGRPLVLARAEPHRCGVRRHVPHRSAAHSPPPARARATATRTRNRRPHAQPPPAPTAARARHRLPHAAIAATSRLPRAATAATYRSLHRHSGPLLTPRVLSVRRSGSGRRVTARATYLGRLRGASQRRALHLPATQPEVCTRCRAIGRACRACTIRPSTHTALPHALTVRGLLTRCVVRGRGRHVQCGPARDAALQRGRIRRTVWGHRREPNHPIGAIVWLLGDGAGVHCEPSGV
jgi:hypothetical protein